MHLDFRYVEMWKKKGTSYKPLNTTVTNAEIYNMIINGKQLIIRNPITRWPSFAQTLELVEFISIPRNI